MMKPILFIYPPYEGRFFLKSRGPFPLGPLSIAAYLEDNGYEAYVKDFSYPPKKHKSVRPRELRNLTGAFHRYGFTDEEIRSWLDEHLDDYHEVVGVSSLMSSFYYTGYRIVDMIKELRPDKTVVMGGPHATAFPNHVFENCNVDYVCVGEGEEAFLDFLETESRVVRGIYSKSEFEYPSVHIRDYEVIPRISFWQLLDDRELDYLMVTWSRSCPMICSFCGSWQIQGRKWRPKEPETIIQELDALSEEWGVRRFEIEDDNICPGTKGREWLKEICRLLIEHDFRFRFHVPHGMQVHSTQDEELCDLMWEAGFREMVFPVESTDPDVLKHMRKPNTVKPWKAAVRNWREKGRPCEVIFGYPFVQTIGTMIQTMKDIAGEGCILWPSHFRLNKGTPLFDQCVEAGYVDESYDPIHTHEWYLETERFDVEDLKELVRMSRGVNYGTENGWDVFTEPVENICSKQFLWHGGTEPKVGQLIARGSFGFKKGQDNFARILLSRLGWKGKPKIVIEDDVMFFLGVEHSNTYNHLFRSFGNKDDGGIRKFT